MFGPTNDDVGQNRSRQTRSKCIGKVVGSKRFIQTSCPPSSSSSSSSNLEKRAKGVSEKRMKEAG